MIHQPAKIARNTTYFTTALVIQKIFSFVYFAYLARIMGVTSSGKYIFALSFTTLFAIFIDLGLSAVLTREIAKQPEKSSQYLANTLALKIPLALVVYLVTITAINILDYPLITKQLVYLSGIIMILDSFTLSFWAVFRGHQNLKYESLGSIIFQLILVSLGTMVLFTSQNLLHLMSALLAASLFHFLYSSILLRRKLAFRLKIRPQRRPIILLLKIAVPFALAGIFVRIYTYIDTVLLSVLAGDNAVGWYGAAYKIVFAIQFIPLAFQAAIFPAMSSYFVSNRKFLAKIFEKATAYLLIIVLPMTAGTIILANKFILAIYGQEYEASILVLIILMLALPFVFLNFPIGSLLNACNRQKTQTINVGIVMVLNVVLNLILIRRFAYLGASFTYLFSAIILYILGIYWIGKITFYNKIFLLVTFLKALVASLAMTLVLQYLRQTFSLPLLILSGALVYVLVMYLIGGITKKEIFGFYHSFKRQKI